MNKTLKMITRTDPTVFFLVVIAIVLLICAYWRVTP